MDLRNNNVLYILIAALSILLFSQFMTINTLKTQNNELNTRIKNLENITTTNIQKNIELVEEIIKLNQKITELETQLNLHKHPTPTVETRIPEEWITQAELEPLNLSEMKLKDPYNRYDVKNDSVTWINVNRTLNQGLTGTQLNLSYHIIEFNFRLDNFTFGEGGNRRIITLWAISGTDNVADTRNYTQLYAEQVSFQEGIYELVFHQKVNKNMFVEEGTTFSLNETYHCRVIKYGDYIMYQIFSDSTMTRIIYESAIHELVPSVYSYLYLAYNYPPGPPKDLHITSTGMLSEVQIYPLHNEIDELP